jgi:hypothetical protein
MASKPKNQVATTNENAVAPFSNEVPAYLDPTKNRGSEDVKSTDMVLPRLEIVQAQSPIKDNDPDIREGELFNSVTSEVYGDTIYFVPVYFRTEYLIWKDQDEGGGFFGAFMTQDEANARRNEVIEDGENPEFIEIVDTPVQYGMKITPDGKVEQLVISMAKSKAKVSRKWNSMIQLVGGDRFSRVYKITTFTDENKQGKKFKNFVVQPAGFTPEPAYREAEKLYTVFKTQDVRAAHDTVIDNGEGGSVDRGEV